MSAASNVIRLADSFSNFLAGFGVLGRDKAMSQTPSLTLLTPDDLEKLYRGDWISRKIIDLPADDQTRAWRQWEADEADVELLIAAEQKAGLRRKVYDALMKARLWGGAAMVIGVDDGQGFEKELDLDRVGKDALKFVHVVSGGRLPQITPGQRILDLTSPWYGEPNYYVRSNQPTAPPIGGVEPPPPNEFGIKTGEVMYIHPSRVLRFIGHDYPDIERAVDPWGDSVLQTVYDAVRSAGLVSSAMASMVTEGKLDIIKVSGLTELLSTSAGTNKVIGRFSNANAAKSVINALLIDKDLEEWERKDLRFNQMDRVLQMFLMIVCGAADVPATRMLGREPAGLNATGESDIRNYYDRLASEQEVRLRPRLHLLDEVLIRSALGTRKPEIKYKWNPLWQMSDTEKADVEFKVASAHNVDVQAGLIEPRVLKTGRENYLIANGFMYPGLAAAIDEYEEEEWGEMVAEAGAKQLEMQADPPKPGEPGGPPMPAAKPGGAAPKPGIPQPQPKPGGKI